MVALRSKAKEAHLGKHHPSCFDVCQGLAGLEICEVESLYRVPGIGLNEVHGEASLLCLQSLPGLGELLRESVRPRQGKARILPLKPSLIRLCFWRPSTHQELLPLLPAPLGPMLESALVLQELALL